MLIKKEFEKLKTFDLGYFIGKSYFDEDGEQNYLVFKPILEHFTQNNNWMTKWKSKGLSNENFEVFFTSNITLTPSINYYVDKVMV